MKTKIGQGPEFIERRVYYGYLDQENSNRYANHVRTSWQFECILKNTFDKTPDTRVLKSPDHDFALVRILTTRGRFHRTLTRQQPSTGKWYTLQLGTIGVPAWHYELGDDGYVELENARGYVEHIMPVTPEQDAQLRLAFDSRSLQPTTADAISNAVVSPQFHPRGVAVYDVGQGAAAAIIDNDFRPRIYFDIGRPLPFHKASEPPKLKFCFRLDQLIIISHWDFDHMYAGYKDRRAKQLRWIAPEQVLSPHKLKFARELASNGKLFLWPSSLRAISTPFGELRKCTGTGPNDSGLMLIATVYPTPQSRADVLLSGDADYQYIPGPFNPLTGMVATHHGAAVKSGVAPPPANPVHGGAVAVSWGAGNKYGHPNSDALALHAASGWATPIHTASYAAIPRGNIALIGAPPPALWWHHHHCCGGQCSLSLTKP